MDCLKGFQIHLPLSLCDPGIGRALLSSDISLPLFFITFCPFLLAGRLRLSLSIRPFLHYS